VIEYHFIKLSNFEFMELSLTTDDEFTAIVKCPTLLKLVTTVD
jgi:hypothetical protein